MIHNPYAPPAIMSRNNNKSFNISITLFSYLYHSLSFIKRVIIFAGQAFRFCLDGSSFSSFPYIHISDTSLPHPGAGILLLHPWPPDPSPGISGKILSHGARFQDPQMRSIPPPAPSPPQSHSLPARSKSSVPHDTLLRHAG